MRKDWYDNGGAWSLELSLWRGASMTVMSYWPHRTKAKSASNQWNNHCTASRTGLTCRLHLMFSGWC
jgi:hypothetical protein